MSVKIMSLNEVLKRSFVNGWKLFWLITLPVSSIMLTAMLRTDAWDGPAVSAMIQLSVRCSVPWLLLAFAASSTHILFPGSFSRWLLRNRKFIGLCFAAAMAWQLFFILWLVGLHTEYYVSEVYVLRDAIEGTIGYLFLIAMTLTSFSFGRKRLKAGSWRILHKVGIYYLWAYAFGVYWWELFYYSAPDGLDYLYYAAGFLAWAVRPLAWRKRRRLQTGKNAGKTFVNPALQALSFVLIAMGMLTVLNGKAWQVMSENVLTGYSLTRFPETYLPYWPFEPFLPLLLIALGIYLGAQRTDQEERL